MPACPAAQVEDSLTATFLQQNGEVHHNLGWLGEDVSVALEDFLPLIGFGLWCGFPCWFHIAFEALSKKGQIIYCCSVHVGICAAVCGGE